ncbi:hypothetical protein AGMMS49983_03490 [Clostridia bacterium]|nr:hypothetical protein AGMMS49983_03490 [Clostridia bacterium]
MSELTIYREAVIEIKNAILQSRYRAASKVNIEQLTLNYNIGRYVSDNTRSGKWGSGALENISKQLQGELPGLRGFSTTNMKYMRIFFEQWVSVFEPNRPLPTDDLQEETAIIQIRQLPTDELKEEELHAFIRVGFTHQTEILSKCNILEERWYYIKKCASEFWSVDTLKYHIKANDYSKYGALPNNFEVTLPDKKQASRAVQSFKSEYFLDFINIEEETSDDLIGEPELHAEILNNIRKFIMAFGEDFCFMASKYRVIVEGDENFIDLLFFNRSLHCLVAIELKRGAFKPAYLGQLNFYLSALDEYVKKPDENPSVGIILCKEAKKTVVEFAVRDFNKPIGVSTYTLGNKIPEAYQALIPVIDGVQQLLSENEGEE